MKEALYYDKLKNKQVQCKLCPQNCFIRGGNKGICGVRENINGKLYSLVYGKPIAIQLDPIEKKPLYHFLPGESVLSLGTIGCNLNCQWCFHPDTKIITNKGIMEIRDIYGNIHGLKTISHNGKEQKILNIFKRKNKHELITIKPRYSPEFKCTPEHKLFVYNGNKIIKKKAEDISKEDFLVIPKKINIQKNKSTIDLEDFFKDFHLKTKKVERKTAKFIDNLIKMHKEGATSRQIGIKFNIHPSYVRTLLGRIRKNGKDWLFWNEISITRNGDKIRFKFSKYSIPRLIKIDKDLATLLGYYCAEGHISKLKKRPNSREIWFHFGKHEKKQAQIVKKLTKRIFKIEPRIVEGKTSLDVGVRSNILALFFEKLCGSRSKNKKVPEAILNGDKEIVEGFLKAYVDGDGWVGKQVISINTVSEELAYGIYWLFLRLGLLPGFYIWKPPKKKNIEGRIVNQSTLYYVKLYAEQFRYKFLSIKRGVNKISLRNIRFKENKKYYFVPINNISKEMYNGDVYNLEVDKDHSYLANFVCVGNCQNFNISRAKPEETDVVEVLPEKVIEMCIEKNCKIIAFTYTEPTIAIEYVLDIAKLAKKEKIKCVIVSNGYINEEPLKELCKYIDGANIDLKSFNEKIYKRFCNGNLKEVLRSLKILKENKIWLEITNLVVPEINDNKEEVEKMCKWISSKLGKEVPLHFSKFFPMHKMQDMGETPVSTLEEFKKIAEEYLEFVYLGNIDEESNTVCHGCGEVIIRRAGMFVKNALVKGRCKCGEEIPGVWK